MADNDFSVDLEYPEPVFGCMVSWGDPASFHDFDILAERIRVYPGPRLWRSMSSSETFLWHEVTDLARKSGRPLIIWRRES